MKQAYNKWTGVRVPIAAELPPIEFRALGAD